jgi:hypothetical protein
MDHRASSAGWLPSGGGAGWAPDAALPLNLALSAPHGVQLRPPVPGALRLGPVLDQSGPGDNRHERLQAVARGAPLGRRGVAVPLEDEGRSAWPSRSATAWTPSPLASHHVAAECRIEWMVGHGSGTALRTR